MTTNQTIDGVPRELIEKAMLACFEAGYGIPHDELRALLDAPVPPSKFVGAAQYWSENEQALRDVCKFEGLKGLVYQVVRDCEKPASQPQDEPVAWIVTDMNGDSYFAYDKQTPNDKPLYAEQPAPVAVTGFDHGSPGGDLCCEVEGMVQPDGKLRIDKITHFESDGSYWQAYNNVSKTWSDCTQEEAQQFKRRGFFIRRIDLEAQP